MRRGRVIADDRSRMNREWTPARLLRLDGHKNIATANRTTPATPSGGSSAS